MKQLLLLIAVALTVQANADNYRDMEPLKLETPEMKVELAPTASPAMELVTTADKWKPDFDFFKSKTNPGVKPYKFMDDLSFVGIPLFVAGRACSLTMRPPIPATIGVPVRRTSARS